MERMSEYDPLNPPKPTKEQRRLTHHLDFNGLWLDIKDNPREEERCICHCAKKYHLASVEGNITSDSICLNSQCICMGYVQKGAKIIIPKPGGGQLPKKDNKKVQDQTLTREIGYIQILSKV